MTYGNDQARVVASENAHDLQKEINRIVQGGTLEITGISVTTLGESLVAVVSVRTPT